MWEQQSKDSLVVEGGDCRVKSEMFNNAFNRTLRSMCAGCRLSSRMLRPYRTGASSLLPRIVVGTALLASADAATAAAVACRQLFHVQFGRSVSANPQPSKVPARQQSTYYYSRVSFWSELRGDGVLETRFWGFLAFWASRKLRYQRDRRFDQEWDPEVWWWGGGGEPGQPQHSNARAYASTW